MEDNIYGEDASAGCFGFGMGGDVNHLTFVGGSDADVECEIDPPGERMLQFEKRVEGEWPPKTLGYIIIKPDGFMEFYDGEPYPEGERPIFTSSIYYLTWRYRLKEAWGDLTWPVRRRFWNLLGRDPWNPRQKRRR